MHNNAPRYILDRLQGEPVDFVVQSERDFAKKSLGKIMIIGSILFSWVIFFPLIFAMPLIEMYTSGHTVITVNGVRETFTPVNPAVPIMFMAFPTLLSLGFAIPVMLAFTKGIKYISQEGPWYAGTNKNLIEFKDHDVYYYLWNEFEKSLQTKINENNSMDIILTHKKDIEMPSTDSPEMEKIMANFDVTVNGKPVDLSSWSRGMFRNKIGILGLQNGSYVFNMIRHNMDRFRA